MAKILGIIIEFAAISLVFLGCVSYLFQFLTAISY